MTEAELAEQVTNYGSQGLAAFTVWVSIVAGYLVAAYLAGGNLNRTQVSILNSVYLFVCALLMLAVFGSFRVQAFYATELRAVFPHSPQLAHMYIASGVTAACAGATIASLKFMWDVRHPKEE